MLPFAAHGGRGDVCAILNVWWLAGMLILSMRSGTDPSLRHDLAIPVQRPRGDETPTYGTCIMCSVRLLVTGLPGAHSCAYDVQYAR